MAAGDPVVPVATSPCPVCPLLEEKLRAAREAAYWRAMHRRAVEREAKLKQQVTELEAKLRLREQQLFGRKTESSSATQPAPCVQDRTKRSGDVVITLLAVGDPFYRG